MRTRRPRARYEKWRRSIRASHNVGFRDFTGAIIVCITCGESRGDAHFSARCKKREDANMNIYICIN